MSHPRSREDDIFGSDAPYLGRRRGKGTTRVARTSHVGNRRREDLATQNVPYRNKNGGDCEHRTISTSRPTDNMIPKPSSSRNSKISNIHGTSTRQSSVLPSSSARLSAFPEILNDNRSRHRMHYSKRSTRSNQLPVSHQESRSSPYLSTRGTLNHNHATSSDTQMRRRVKRSNNNAAVASLIRSFIVLIVTYIIVSKFFSVVLVGLNFLFGCISALFWQGGIFHEVNDFSQPLIRVSHHTIVSRLGASYVQNEEQIRHILELARLEYDFEHNGDAKLYSVRKEERLGMFEAIGHPGDPAVKILVPQFYASTSIDEDGRIGLGERKLFRQLTFGKLLTPELSSMIGTFVHDNHKRASNSVFVEDYPERTIFVSIISHGDWSCPQTVENLLNSASNPHRVRVGVVVLTNSNNEVYLPCDEPTEPCDANPDQILCKFRKNVDVYELDPETNPGTTFARHVANRMYRGEFYAMQVGLNADIVLASQWDNELIQQLEATKNEMAIITTYLSEGRDNKHRTHHKGGSSVDVESQLSRITLCHASYERDGQNGRRLKHMRSEQVEQEAPTSRRSEPLLQPYWSSEFSFSRGHFILSVPYDPYLCGIDQQDEEISIALRAFTHGYDFYTPIRSVAFLSSHGHGRSQNSKTEGGLVGKELSHPTSPLCKGKQKKSQRRLNVLIEMASEDEVAAWDHTDQSIFGIGSVRQPKQFFSCFGVHVRQRITEQKLCDFVVSGNLHDEFILNLRPNGMGIDYDNINFRFHELISIHKDNH